MEIKVEYVPVDSIKPYEGNAKEHPQEQIEQIKQSIKEFGFNDPCAVWNGEIVEGHGRYEAAKQLGYTEIPVIRLDGLTDEQRRAYGLIHNQLTMNSGFDAEALEAELASISDIDMSIYAFDMDEEVTQTIRGSEEVSLEDFDDDKFSCTCPQCGFKFNPKEN